MPEPRWQAFERDVAEMFGLDQTLSSGNQWFDAGDAVTRGRTTLFPLYAECKYTESRSKTLSLRDLQAGQELAASTGKRFVMPIRFRPEREGHDYAVVSLSDLAELLQMVRE